MPAIPGRSGCPQPPVPNRLATGSSSIPPKVAHLEKSTLPASKLTFWISIGRSSAPILFGNDTSAIGSTPAGALGQCLQSNSLATDSTAQPAPADPITTSGSDAPTSSATAASPQRQAVNAVQ